MNIIESIVTATDIIKLLGGLKLLLEECVGSVDHNTLCNELVKAIDQKINAHASCSGNNCDDYNMFDVADSPLFLLNAYLYGAENCEEIIQSIGEFIDICSGLENLGDTDEYADGSSGKIQEDIEADEMPCQATGGDLIKEPLLLFPKAKQAIEICFIHPILLEYSMGGLQCFLDKKLKIQNIDRQNPTDLHRYFIQDIVKWHIWLLSQKKLE